MTIPLSRRAAGRVRRWLGLDAPAGAAPAPAEQAAPAGDDARPAPDLTGLEKQVAKLGREQFKLNALLETQQAQTQAALQLLGSQHEHIQRDASALAARRQADLADARLQLAQRLLPAVDGLDEAIASGRRFIDRWSAGSAPPPPGGGGAQLPAHRAWPKWAAFPVALAGMVADRVRAERPSPPQPAAEPARPEVKVEVEAISAWLDGLRIVRERLLQTLQAEGIEPIAAVGRPFDPQFHVAVDTIASHPGCPAGVVAAEIRRGYAAGPRILRYAEVAVARDPEQAS